MALRRTGFSQSHFHFMPKKVIFSFCNFPLLSMTLTYELDLDMLKLDHHAIFNLKGI